MNGVILKPPSCPYYSAMAEVKYYKKGIIGENGGNSTKSWLSPCVTLEICFDCKGHKTI